MFAAQSTGGQHIITQRKKLKDANFSDQQADAIIEVCVSVAPGLATKSDLELFSTELRNDIAAFSTELRNDLAAFKTELRNDIAAFRVETRVFFVIILFIVSANSGSPVVAFLKRSDLLK